MDERQPANTPSDSIDWLGQLSPQTVVLVPTRTLANVLNEQVSQHYRQQGRTVWEAPNVLNWSDYLGLLWDKNRALITQQTGAQLLISPQQASLLWTQVIDSSRREENALTLLNVQQTTRAVQRSWRLMVDWRVSAEAMALDHVADTEQFIRWLDAYQSLLRKRHLIDTVGLLNQLCASSDLLSKVQHPFTTQVWYCFDLVTDAQGIMIEQAALQGVTVHQRHSVTAVDPVAQYHCYNDTEQELLEVLRTARGLIEKEPQHSVAIVVPDLERRYAQVQELARAVFYPQSSPLVVQNSPCVYRLSLGKALNEWASVATALNLIKLLRNRTTVTEFSGLLRNQLLMFSRQHADAARYFERWLKRQRLRALSLSELPSLYQQCVDDYAGKGIELPGTLMSALQTLVERLDALQSQLKQAKQQTEYASLSFLQWAEFFQQWLDSWGWQQDASEHSLSSVEYQLFKRWQRLLDEFASLNTVQRSAGLARAIEVITQLARDSVFLPQSAESPIVISGVFEAIGRPVETCFVLGQNQLQPSPAQSDAFVPNRLLANTGYPDASAELSFAQASKVQASLLRSAQRRIVSYALFNDQDRDIKQLPSPLYRRQSFESIGQAPKISREISLEDYQDTHGPAWADPSKARGGSAIFTNQSNCAFKAFATHQLGFLQDDEAEFGLDGLDRGDIVHRLLDRTWHTLQQQSELLAMDEDSKAAFVQRMVNDTINDTRLTLNDDKRVLLRAEQQRLIVLLSDWLTLEAARPQGFAVVEREQHGRGTIGGIEFDYIIDRLDITDDGRSVVVDYKTGSVARNDWSGERLRSPQLPLYALALDAVKRQAVSGIAYANIRQYDHKFTELSESDIFRPENHIGRKYQIEWERSRQDWPALFDALAQDFIAGKAIVNPIDEKTCQFCCLQAVCRVSQLRQQTEQAHD